MPFISARDCSPYCFFFFFVHTGWAFLSTPLSAAWLEDALCYVPSPLWMELLSKRAEQSPESGRYGNHNKYKSHSKYKSAVGSIGEDNIITLLFGEEVPCMCSATLPHPTPHGEWALNGRTHYPSLCFCLVLGTAAQHHPSASLHMIKDIESKQA